MTDTPDAPRGPAASGHAQPTEMPELPGVTHAFVTLSTGLRMHIAEAGNPDASTVLLLHGFPQHWWEWRKVIPPLAERYPPGLGPWALRTDRLARHLLAGFTDHR